MPKTYDVDAELKAIKSILDGNDAVRGYLLAEMSDDYCVWDCTAACLTRILTLVREGKQIPNSSVFVTDPVLSDEAKTAIRDCTFPAVPDRDSAEALIASLRHYRTVRVAYFGAKDVVRSIKDDGVTNASELVDRLEKAVLDARSVDASSKIVMIGHGDDSLADKMVSSIIESPADLERIPTGFKNFDTLAGGFRRTNLVLIAGPTGGGKSALANQICKNAYFDSHYSTCMVSFEMDEEENMGRLISNISQVPHAVIDRRSMSAAQRTKVYDAWARFRDVGKTNNCRFSIWHPSGDLTAGQIVSYLKPLRFDVVVVDYVGLVGADNDKLQQWESLGRIARAFKIAATPLNAVVILLAQFDSDKQILRYSRAMKDHANIMWQWTYGQTEQQEGHVLIDQSKNRNVKPFRFYLKFNLDTMSIVDSPKQYVPQDDKTGDRKGSGKPGKKYKEESIQITDDDAKDM